MKIPFVASGGMADARSLVAALAMGAAGMNMGTRFIATKEAPVHDNVKQAIVGASELDTLQRRHGWRIRHSCGRVASEAGVLCRPPANNCWAALACASGAKIAGQATMTRKIGDVAGRGRRNLGRGPKVVASRLCDLRASTSAVRQADRLRGAAHPVVNIRTSEHHIPSRPRLSVRMFGS